MQFSILVDADSPADLRSAIELLETLLIALVPEDHVRKSVVEILALSSGAMLRRVWREAGRHQFDIVTMGDGDKKLQRTLHSQLANLARAGKRRSITLFLKHGAGSPQQLSLSPQVADVLAELLPGSKAE